MAHFIARERNEHGVRVFFDQLQRLLVEFRDLSENQHVVTDDFIETMVRRLEDASCTLQMMVEHMSATMLNNTEENNQHSIRDRNVWDILKRCLETQSNHKVSSTCE